jgi:uncharacterized membrane protein YccF (DUF307 family)
MSRDGKKVKLRRAFQTVTNILIRAVWFIFIGIWATPLLLYVAWFCNATVILVPVGIKLINYAPFVASLKEGSEKVEMGEGSASASLPVRAVYFVLVGWWLSLIWITVAAVFTVSIVGFPIAVTMYSSLPYVTSLYKI